MQNWNGSEHSGTSTSKYSLVVQLNGKKPFHRVGSIGFEIRCRVPHSSGRSFGNTIVNMQYVKSNAVTIIKNGMSRGFSRRHAVFASLCSDCISIRAPDTSQCIRLVLSDRRGLSRCPLLNRYLRRIRESRC